MNETIEPPVFTAELTPHRSLGRTGVRIMVGLTLSFALFNVLFFLVSGAWPIAFFFGLDIALLYGAFYLNYRSGRIREEIAMSRTLLQIRKFSPAGKMKEWRYNPFWTRFDVTRHDEYGITAMKVVSRNGRTDVGTFLNPDDRESFAKAFGGALATLKRRL